MSLFYLLSSEFILQNYIVKNYKSFCPVILNNFSFVSAVNHHIFLSSSYNLPNTVMSRKMKICFSCYHFQCHSELGKAAALRPSLTASQCIAHNNSRFFVLFTTNKDNYTTANSGPIITLSMDTHTCRHTWGKAHLNIKWTS